MIIDLLKKIAEFIKEFTAKLEQLLTDIKQKLQEFWNWLTNGSGKDNQ